MHAGAGSPSHAEKKFKITWINTLVCVTDKIPITVVQNGTFNGAQAVPSENIRAGHEPAQIVEHIWPYFADTKGLHPVIIELTSHSVHPFGHDQVHRYLPPLH